MAPQGGGIVSGVKQFVGDAARELRNPEMYREAFTPAGLKQTGKGIAKAAVSIPAETLKGISGAAATLNTELPQVFSGPTDERQMGFYRMGEAMNRFVDRKLPDDPNLQGNFIADTLPKAVGSGLGFIAQAALLRGAGAGASTAIGTSGALVGASGAREEARQAGVTDPKTLARVTEGGGALGTSELLGVGSVARRLLGGKVGGRVLKDFLSEMVEETVQETGQTVGGNLLAKKLYDADRGLLEGAGQAGAAGAGAGGLLSLLASVIAGRKMGGRNFQSAEEVESAIDEVLAEATPEERSVFERMVMEGEALTPETRAQAEQVIQQLNLRGMPVQTNEQRQQTVEKVQALPLRPEAGQGLEIIPNRPPEPPEPRIPQQAPEQRAELEARLQARGARVVQPSRPIQEPAPVEPVETPQIPRQAQPVPEAATAQEKPTTGQETPIPGIPEPQTIPVENPSPAPAAQAPSPEPKQAVAPAAPKVPPPAPVSPASTTAVDRPEPSPVQPAQPATAPKAPKRQPDETLYGNPDEDTPSAGPVASIKVDDVRALYTELTGRVLDGPTRKSHEATLKEAIAQGIPERARVIAQEVLANPRPLSDVETAGSTAAMANLLNQQRELYGRIGSGTIPDSEVDSAMAQAEIIQGDLETILEAASKHGTEAGRGLNARKIMLRLTENFDFAIVKARAKLKKGSALTPKEVKRLETEVRRLEKLNEAYKEKMEKLKQESGDKAVQHYKKHGKKMSADARKTELKKLADRANELHRQGCPRS